MISMSSQRDSQQLRRDLRARIARVRRRIDQRLGVVRSSRARWNAWREHAVRSPLLALLAAVTAGLSLASIFRGRKTEKKDGPCFPADDAFRLARWAIGKLWFRFRSRAATGSDPRPAEAEGGEHGGT
jgi:hypothetical protein